jgi:hypothetical protein
VKRIWFFDAVCGGGRGKMTCVLKGRTLGKMKSEYENDIKVKLKICYEFLHWVVDNFRAVVFTVMNFRLPYQTNICTG